MALQAKERYDSKKVERLAEHLRLYFEKGQPIDFEIIVDGFKVVRRTNDPEMFSMYESFIDADTKSMEILLYNGGSNNNDKTIFYFGEVPRESLSGLDIDNRIDEGVQRKLKEKEYDELKKENKELQEEIDQLEEQVSQLEKEQAAILADQSPLKGVFGEIGSSLVESFIKRNPQVMKNIPGGEALAGLITSNEETTESHEATDTEVNFRPKSAEESSELSQEDRAAIEFVNQLKSQFSKEEFDKVLSILQTLADDKTKIDLIVNHINIHNNQP